jgi:toxin YoeB
MNVVFMPLALQNLQHFVQFEPKIAQKLLVLIEDCRRSPFSGLGKPEPLRHDLKGWWSRRITDEHRLVYRVVGETIEVAQCRFHY